MHSTPRALLAAVLLVPLPALALAPDGWSLSLAAVEPLPEGGARLLLDADALAPSANATLVVHANLTRDDGTTESTAFDAGIHALAPGARVAIDWPAAPGVYEVDVVADAPGSRGAARSLAITLAAPAQAALVLDVADAPPSLAFTSDAVNGAGKAKAPGDALVARVAISDANGLDDVAALEFRYDRVLAGGARQPAYLARRVGLDGGNASLTQAVIEERFDSTPAPAGDWVQNVTLVARSGAARSIERAFRITDARPALLSVTGFADPLVADGPASRSGSALVGDRNLGSGPLDPTSVAGSGFLRARLFRGSTEMLPASGWRASFPSGSGTLDLSTIGHRDEGVAYVAVDGVGAVALPVEVAAPANATAGEYRLSLYHAASPNGTATLLGSQAFTLAAPARVALVDVAPARVAPGAPVTVAFSASGADAVVLRLLRGGAELARARATASPATLLVPLDVPSGPIALEALAVPKAGFVAVAPAVATIDVEAGAPSLSLAHGRSRISIAPAAPQATFALAARNFTLAEAAIDVALVDASGSAVPGERVARAADGFALDATGLAAGRYRLVARATAADGRVATLALPVDVGAWLALRVPAPRATLAPAANGRLDAALPVASDGNAPVAGLVVAVAPIGGVPMEGEVRLVDASGAVRATATLARGRAILASGAAALLSPGEGGELRFALAKPAGLDAGRHEATVRVLLVPGRSA